MSWPDAVTCLMEGVRSRWDASVISSLMLPSSPNHQSQMRTKEALPVEQRVDRDVFDWGHVVEHRQGALLECLLQGAPPGMQLHIRRVVQVCAYHPSH